MSKFSGQVWDTSTGVEGMVRHAKSGRFYSRVQVAGSRSFKALKTKTWSVAKLRHLDRVAKAERQRQRHHRVVVGHGLMGDLFDKFRDEYLASTTKSQSSKTGIQNTIDRIERFWPLCFGNDLRLMKPQQVTIEHARRFANYLHAEAQYRKHNVKDHATGYGAVTVNKTIELIHLVLRVAVETGALPMVPFELDPAVGGPVRVNEPQTKLRLPSSEKMREVFEHMRIVTTLPEERPELRAYCEARSRDSADFAEFMAFCGARVSEAATFRWEDDLADSVILRGTKSESSRDREVPKIAALRELLTTIRHSWVAGGRELKGGIFAIKDCRVALETGCRKAGVERLTHHSLRHFFATICIEAGVDIPTISRWLGHGDGGALAMRTYGHLRREHSFAAAAKVSMPTRARPRLVA